MNIGQWPSSACTLTKRTRNPRPSTVSVLHLTKDCLQLLLLFCSLGAFAGALQNNENGRSQEVEVFCRQRRLVGGHLEISVGLANYSMEYICCGIHACTRRHQWGSIQLLSETEAVHNVGPKNGNISWCGALHNVISFLVLLFLGLSFLVSLRCRFSDWNEEVRGKNLPTLEWSLGGWMALA